MFGNFFGSTIDNLRNNPLTIKGTKILNNTKNKFKMDLIDKTSTQLENLKKNQLVWILELKVLLLYQTEKNSKLISQKIKKAEN